MMKIRNYGRNWSFVPSAVERPSDEHELRLIVARASKLRVMGSAHSWSKAIVTDHTLVSLDRMNRVVHIDDKALLATVEAGIKLRALIAALEERGFALSNLGSIDAQSLAGAISTGTHGTGMGFRCLASQVESFRLVDAEGNVRRLAKGDPDFDAVIVGLGCFGVIFEMTIAIVPSFQMHAVTDTVPFDDVIENLDRFVRGHDHFKLWWLVPSDDVIVFENDRTDAARDDSDLTRWFKDEFLAVIVYRSLIALQKLDRKRLVPLSNRLLGKEVGKRFERTCKSHVGFLTPAPPVHREAEWAFDYSIAKPLLKAYRTLLLNSGYTYNFIQEVRFTQADDFWLSPASGRETIWLSLYNMDSAENWKSQLALFEAFAKDHGGRPHWGKEASFDRADLMTRWPRMVEFRKLMRVYDPKGKLTNPWVEQIFGE